MKVKRSREGGFCVTSSFWVLFCDGSFFYPPFYVSSKPIKFFFITMNLVLIYKLSTIENFYQKVSNFATILIFLGFCLS